MNRTCPLAFVMAMMLQVSSPAMSEPIVESEQARCAKITVSKPVRFDGRILDEIPDIKERELRLANELLSSDCWDRADEIFARFVKAHPGNVHANYYVARRAWMTREPERAQQLLELTLMTAPDFASAKVLLAGLDYTTGNLPRMRRLLDEAEAASPEDVWIYVNRSRLEALEKPGATLRSRMLEMARNDAFPPNVRAYAAEIAKRLPGGDYEESLRAAVGVRTPFTACEYAELATYMSEAQGRFAEVRELLESPEASRGNCLGLQQNRILLAQAYLMEAASISPQPSPANYELVVKANKVIGSDYLALTNWVIGRPQAEILMPFLRTNTHPDDKDEHGVSSICYALDTLDGRLVREYLDDGANPRGDCHGMPLMHRLTYLANGRRVEDLHAVANALLDYGAAPVIEPCRSNDNSRYCSRDLLPLLERRASKSK